MQMYFLRIRCLPGEDVKHFHLGQYILMHSVIYRTQMLKELWTGAAEAYLLCG